jgi:hypothetical protein
VSAKAPPLTEQQFQDQITELAEMCGWAWLHCRPGMTARSWRTPVSGPLGKGFPDLLMVRPRDLRVLAAELKRDGQKPTPDQMRVLEILSSSGIETFVWHPAEFEHLKAILR